MTNNIIIAGLLMVFGTTGAAFYTHMPRTAYRSWVNNGFVSLSANTGGFVIGFYSIYYLGSHLGWLTGIGTWIAVGLISALIIRMFMGIYPIILAVSIMAMFVGAFLSFT